MYSVMKNPLSDINNYKDEMTISQVVRFFERQGISFTKTMIQNYVRSSVIPPPKGNRYYLHLHLFLLTVINDLKDIYSLEDLRRMLSNIVQSADELGGADFYPAIIDLYLESKEKWLSTVPSLIENTKESLKALQLPDCNNDGFQNLITMLMVSAQSTVAKKTAISLNS